jgi:hypothetical protein
MNRPFPFLRFDFLFSGQDETPPSTQLAHQKNA